MYAYGNTHIYVWRKRETEGDFKALAVMIMVAGKSKIFPSA